MIDETGAATERLRHALADQLRGGAAMCPVPEDLAPHAPAAPASDPLAHGDNGPAVARVAPAAAGSPAGADHASRAPRVLAGAAVEPMATTLLASSNPAPARRSPTRARKAGGDRGTQHRGYQHRGPLDGHGGFPGQQDRRGTAASPWPRSSPPTAGSTSWSNPASADLQLRDPPVGQLKLGGQVHQVAQVVGDEVFDVQRPFGVRVVRAELLGRLRPR